MTLKQSQLPKTPPSPPGYRPQPERPTAPTPTTSGRLRSPDGSAQPKRTRAVRMAPAPPYCSSLMTDIAFLESAAATKLDRLAKPTKALLVALRSASNAIQRNHSTLGIQLHARLRATANTTAMLVRQTQASRPAAGREDAKLTQQSIESKVAAEAVASLSESLASAQAASAQSIATSILAKANELEDALASAKLDALGITDASKLNLEELLRRQSVISDLESRGSNELLDFYQQLCRLKPDEATTLEGPLLKISKQRAALVEGRGRARMSSNQQAAEQDRLAAVRLVGRIETARELRVGPEIACFETEFRPLLGSLIRRTIGIEISDLDRASFEKYAQKYRPGARLGDITPRYGWLLRSALSELHPLVRRQVPAKFFSPVE